MEELARILIVAIVILVAILLAGLYLLNRAVSEGNVWMGIVAVLLVLISGGRLLGGLAAR